MTDLAPSLSSLDLEPEIRAALAGRSVGLDLFAGRAGSGKSSLAFAIAGAALSGDLRLTDREHVKAITISPDSAFDLSTCERDGNRVMHLQLPHEARNDEAKLKKAMVHGMKLHANLIVVDPVTRAQTLMDCVMAGLGGHRTLAVVNGGDVADVLQWGAVAATFAMSPLSERERVLDFADSLNVVVAQRMLPRAGGGTVSCREWLVVDDEVRDALKAFDCTYWDEVFRDVAADGSKARTFERSAELLLGRGLIDRATFEGVAGTAEAA